MPITLRPFLAVVTLALLLGTPAAPSLAAPKPVYIGLDAEFGYTSSTSAEAIREGVEIAMEQINRSGMLLLNTSWGRSNLKAAEKYAASHPDLKLTCTNWFNWNDRTFIEKYRALLAGGAQAIVLVSNANEAQILIKEVAALPQAQRVPIISHWGVTGGNLVELAGPALRKVDFSVVQTYSFIGADSDKARQVVAAHNRLFKTRGAAQIKSPVGVAHAYDLTQILALAINRAGSTDRKAIRDALEHLGSYRGLIKQYRPPFTPGRHEALSVEDVFMARFADDGSIVRIGPKGAKALRE